MVSCWRHVSQHAASQDSPSNHLWHHYRWPLSVVCCSLLYITPTSPWCFVQYHVIQEDFRFFIMPHTHCACEWQNKAMVGTVGLAVFHIPAQRKCQKLEWRYTGTCRILWYERDAVNMPAAWNWTPHDLSTRNFPTSMQDCMVNTLGR